MKFRDLLVNPLPPDAVPSFSEWNETKDGWEGLPLIVHEEKKLDRCSAVGEAIKWMKEKKSGDLRGTIPQEVERYVNAMKEFFSYGYHTTRDTYLEPFKEMLECKPNFLALNPLAGKIGPRNTWVRGTRVKFSVLEKFEPTSVNRISRGVISIELADFMYTSSASLQSWSDNSAEGRGVASRFAMMSKNNMSGTIGMMMTAEIPHDQMLFSTSFTDMIKQKLGMPNEIESVRVGKSPIKVNGKVWFNYNNLDTIYKAEVFIKKLLKKVEPKDAEILQKWLDDAGVLRKSGLKGI